ncbi:MAG: zinc-ribbon domain-containing protein, partial [Bacteroidia bacterium]|nr:zinc-ribbon domain-containing protein [Bacteroidia bacterium]
MFRIKQKVPYCLNCNTKLSDAENYCPNCG